jgi:hypothetical protein
MVMPKQRNEQLEFDDGTSFAKMVKFIALGFSGLLVAGGVLGGAVFLMKRGSNNPEEARMNMPSLNGILMSAATGGKVNAKKWDETMGDVCASMAGVSAMVSGRDDDSASRAALKSAQRACRNGRF